MNGLEIHLENLGKRYLRRWIFRDLTHRIAPGTRMGVTGPNGSGKSTLLKILIGALAPSEGQVSFAIDDKAISNDAVFRNISFAAPYTDLIEEMTLREFLGFHVKFRPLQPGMSEASVIELLGNQFNTSTYIKSYSSGMKQRVRLVMAVCTAGELVVLDEPTSNLDEEGKQWYADLLELIDKHTTVIIASNEHQDMAGCKDFIHIPDYSPSK